MTGHYDFVRIKAVTDAVAVAQSLGVHLTQKGKQHVGLCPFHEDKNPSFAVYQSKGSSTFDRCSCFPCDLDCDIIEFVSKVKGLSAAGAVQFLADRAGMSPTPIGRVTHSRMVSTSSKVHASVVSTSVPTSASMDIVAQYDYCDENGALLYQVVRLAPKDFRQRRPDGHKWNWGVADVRRVLFRLPAVITAAREGATIFVCEGEKDVVALEDLGLVATTNAGGAGKWLPEYTQSLRGLKELIILPDNDKAGRDHAEKVAASCHDAGIPVKVIALPGLPEKGDVSDWIGSGGTRDQLEAIVRGAAIWTPVVSRDDREEVGSLGSPIPREKSRVRPILHAAAFHGPLGDLVRVIEPTTEADSAGLLLNCLVFFGNCIGHGPRTLAGSAQYGNLFLVTCGDTAQARKGTATDAVKAAFRSLDPAWASTCIHSGLSSGEGLIFHVRDAVSGGEGGDIGVEDKRALIIESEFASVLKRMRGETNSLSPTLRSAWDGGCLQTLTRKAGGRDPLRATDPHISGIFHITAEELRVRLDPTDRCNGLSNRILWASVNRSKLVFDPIEPDAVAYKRVLADVAASIDFARKLGDVTIKRDLDADVLWRDAYKALSEDRPGIIGPMTTRAGAQACRLAMIYALADGSQTIRREHLAAALAVVRFCEASVVHIFGDESQTALHDRIVTNLEAASDEGLNRKQLHKALNGHYRRRQVEGTLDDLVRGGQIRRCTYKTKGRPDERFFLCEADTSPEGGEPREPTFTADWFDRLGPHRSDGSPLIRAAEGPPREDGSLGSHDSAALERTTTQPLLGTPPAPVLLCLGVSPGKLAVDAAHGAEEAPARKRKVVDL